MYHLINGNKNIYSDSINHLALGRKRRLLRSYMFGPNVGW